MWRWILFKWLEYCTEIFHLASLKFKWLLFCSLRMGSIFLSLPFLPPKLQFCVHCLDYELHIISVKLVSLHVSFMFHVWISEKYFLSFLREKWEFVVKKLHPIWPISNLKHRSLCLENVWEYSYANIRLQFLWPHYFSLAYWFLHVLIKPS